MKSKIIKLSSILVGVFFFLAIFGISPIVAKASEELYFDENGNLYYVAREKKATGSIKYYTIGWIIKRYDMPIDVPGQQYVIVTKSSYKPDMVDPNDSRYVYCYYRSDKEEILNAVKSVSSDWYNQLEKYGDTVYIDSVMTVLEKGVQKGYLYEGGRYTGEVYFDYEGIAGARSWASPQSLLVNFGMSVEFPPLYKAMAWRLKDLNSEKKTISNSFFSAATNGSDSYNIEEGIPSGESIYIKSSVSKGIYNIDLKYVTGEIVMDIKVPVTYILKWTDYYGVKQEQIREVDRYYTVKRAFSYYTYEGYSEEKLVGIELDSQLFDDVKKIEINTSDENSLDDGSIKYGEMGKHMVGMKVSVDPNIDPIVVTSNTYLKPSIPDGDYSSYAEKMVEQIKVRSDKVVIDGKEILSDETMVSNGCEPINSFVVDNVSISEDNLFIKKEIENGEGYTVIGKYLYVNNEGNISEYDMSGLKKVVVHTPVVCNTSYTGEKTMNQAVNPTVKDAVLGSYIIVAFNDFGTHRSIKGYGTRSYTSYVGKRQVKCEFDVIYKGVTYEAGTWIDTKDYYMRLYVCENNREGNYVIETRTLAHNIIDNYGSDVFEEKANLSVSKYGATGSEEVRLIGRIEGLELKVNGEEKYPVDMPYNVIMDNKLNASKEYTLKIETLGDISEEDYLEVHYNYYIKDGAGEYIPVWVYEVESRDAILGEQINKLTEVEIWNKDNLSLNGNKGVWQKESNLPMEYMVVHEGITKDSVKQAIKEGTLDGIVIKNNSLYVAVEFIRYKDGEAYISYINEENAKKGYCNMWITEGGQDSPPYGMILEIGTNGNIYDDYDISGTH